MSQQHEFDPSIPHYGCHACNAEKLPEPRMSEQQKPDWLREKHAEDARFVAELAATPEPSVRALLVHLPELFCERHIKTIGDGGRYGYEDKPESADGQGGCGLCIGERLEFQLIAQRKELADLQAEMQRFAETQRIGWATASHAEYPVYSTVGQRALAWAARLQELQR